MSPYKQAYISLFNSVTDVISALERATLLKAFIPPAIEDLIIRSMDDLKRAQQRAEECYISEERPDEEPHL